MNDSLAIIVVKVHAWLSRFVVFALRCALFFFLVLFVVDAPSAVVWCFHAAFRAVAVSVAACAVLVAAATASAVLVAAATAVFAKGSLFFVNYRPFERDLKS